MTAGRSTSSTSSRRRARTGAAPDELFDHLDALEALGLVDRRRGAPEPAENPAGKHGVHAYTAEEFGLDSTDLAERFAAYRDAFALN